ncbi:unnamed protein product, partial [Rotaria magnacalcarata]
NTNHKDATITIDTEVFVIIGAIPWFIVLPLCSGVYLLLKLQRNVVEESCDPTERTGLLADSQDTNINDVELEPKSSHEKSIGINRVPLASTKSKTGRTKQLCCQRWGFFFAMIVVSIAYILNSSADYYTSSKEFSNKTRMAYPWHRARTACHVIAYTVNPFLLVPVLIHLLVTYRHIAMKSDKLRNKFVENPHDMQLGISEITERGKKFFFHNKNINERIKLRHANNFATAYLSCCLIWSLGTVYYVYKTKSSIFAELGLYLKCIAHLVSYATLVLFMWWTNRSIDEMKETITMRLNFNLLKKEEPTTEIVALQAVLKYSDPYAEIFKMKPSVPSIIITVISTGAPILVSLVKKELFGNI